MIRALFYLILVYVATALELSAHPVAQGAMKIEVAPDKIKVVARVSSEEAFVALALGKTTEATTLHEVWQRHGDYLLHHIHVFADDRPLTGHLGNVTPPAGSAASDNITYELLFELARDQLRPSSMTIKQDVLNEFSFAPGNAWEATYIVKIAQENRLLREGILLTSREPINVTCNWDQAASSTGLRTETAMAWAFLRHGIHHILGGYDHLLFIAGLVLAVVSLWDLVKVVTAFTLAHTLTLTLAVLDVVRLSNRIVEPMIAASIIFVAVQNLVSPSQARGRLRLAIAFGFGLFHGLGFAGGLLSAMEGMRSAAVATAIIAFSLGVEIGHQAVALPLFAAIKLTEKYNRQTNSPTGLPVWILRLGSGAICAAGSVYLVAALR
ncbi:MAG TPA: HupE/UreJ family protein [Chthoniobacterales bacterium]|nr:HupE/UreJ family protein [Chthoniobacterales bacterium]